MKLDLCNQKPEISCKEIYIPKKNANLKDPPASTYKDVVECGPSLASTITACSVLLYQVQRCSYGCYSQGPAISTFWILQNLNIQCVLQPHSHYRIFKCSSSRVSSTTNGCNWSIGTPDSSCLTRRSLIPSASYSATARPLCLRVPLNLSSAFWAHSLGMAVSDPLRGLGCFKRPHRNFQRSTPGSLDRHWISTTPAVLKTKRGLRAQLPLKLQVCFWRRLCLTPVIGSKLTRSRSIEGARCMAGEART